MPFNPGVSFGSGAPPPPGPDDPERGPRAESTGYTGIGSRYGAPGRGGFTWDLDADQRFSAENPIDPRTGLPSGPGAYGTIPAGLGLQYQAAHDRKIWELRQRMMRGGLNYGKGALNLLQSFRAGGGAAIESGVYQNLAGLKFHQAQLTQPLDLLGDYRREEASQARMKANRQAERQMAVQIIGTAAALGVGLATAGAGTAALGAITAGLNAYGASKSQIVQPGTAERSQPRQPGMQDGSVMPSGVPGQQPAPLPGPGIDTATGGVPGGGYGPPAPAGGGAAQATLQPGQSPQGGEDQPGGPVGQQDQPQGAGGAAGAAQPIPGVGADGNFTATAYAANGAMMQSHPIQGAMLSKMMADQIDEDPFYAAFSEAVNVRFLERV